VLQGKAARREARSGEIRTEPARPSGLGASAIVLLALLPVLAAPAPVSAQAYTVDPAQSSVVVHVGKAGLFSFAGHEHEVVSSRFRGEVVAVPEDLARSSVRLAFEAAGLQVSQKNEPAGDAPKVQETMEGPKVLDAARFPTITFVSRGVSGKPVSTGIYDLEVAGDLTLHGVTARLRLPVRVELRGDLLKANGRLVLNQTSFGMSPVSVAGVVKVKDEIAIDFAIAAARVPGAPR
jgi:polyisoprenoid-binding protein YceI